VLVGQASFPGTTVSGKVAPLAVTGGYHWLTGIDPPLVTPLWKLARSSQTDERLI